jgi:O-antigen ligase
MKRIISDYLLKLGLFFLSVTLFIISFPRSWSLYPLGTFLILGLTYWILNFKKCWTNLISNWYLIFPPILFFLIQFINSIINSSPLALLEDRLMFILIPVFGFPFFSNNCIKSNIRKILLAFIFGIILIVLFLIVRLTYFVFVHADTPSMFEYIKTSLAPFLSNGFSIVEHPTYLSIKIIWIFILIFLIPDDLEIARFIRVIITLVLSLGIFLLSSKAGMIAWMIFCSIYLLYYLKNKRISSVLRLVTVSLFVLLSLTLINRNGRVKAYLYDVKRNFRIERFDWKNIDQRTREWVTAISLIKESPLIGFGMNQIQNKTVERYIKYGYVLEAEMKVNAHNQLLETQVTFGIFGTLTLLWMLLTPIIFKNRLKYSKLAIAFVLLMSYYLSIESMFNRQWGIMFFVLFYCILVTNLKENEDLQNRPDGSCKIIKN